MSKICLLCGANINLQGNFAKLCSSCWHLYKKYKNELWYKELQVMQSAQEYIDRKECHRLTYGMESDLYGNYTQANTRQRAMQRVRNYTIAEKVLALYDKSLEEEELGLGKRLTLREIVKLIDYKLTHIAVRDILVKYKRPLNKRGRRNGKV